MMGKCKKCGNSDISIRYRKKDEEYDAKNISNFSEYLEFHNPYKDRRFYVTHISIKEHLACICRKCGYGWAEDTKDIK